MMKPKCSFEEYEKLAKARENQSKERKGEAWITVLFEVNPRLYMLAFNAGVNPFYDDGIFKTFYWFARYNWYA